MNERRAFMSSRRKQRGSILVPAAMGLLIGAVLLGGIQIGYLIYAKRDMQKAADLAALTGAQVLNEGTPAECAQATLAASTAAQTNTASGFAASNMEVSCARWDPAKNSATNGYLATTQAGERSNAIKITMSRNLPSMVPFMEGDTLTVESVAARPGNPVAAFSIGTTLVNAQGQPGNLINLLAAAGVNLDSTALVGYDAGLANVKITTAGLLNALGIHVDSDTNVGDLNNLLASHTVVLHDLIKAVITAGGQSELLSADLLVNGLKSKFGLDNLSVVLGSASADRGASLFAAINAPDGQSALNAQVNALDLIATAVGVATSGHALQSDVSIPLGLLNVSASSRVVEPAQIAIGGVGTQAFSAQVRVFVDVNMDTSKLTVIGSLLPFLKFSIDLPIVVDVASATGTLTDLCTQQDPSGHDLATISVQPSLLQTCIGDLNGTSAFSSAQVCGDKLADKQLLTLMLGSLDLGLKSHLSIDPIPIDPLSATLYEQQQTTVSIGSTRLGDGVTSAVNQVLTTLISSSAAKGAVPAQAAATSSQLASQLWSNALAQNPCDPGPLISGYNCRKTTWAAATAASSAASSTLNTYITDQKITGLLGGVTTLLSNLTSTLGSVLGAVTNKCAPLLGGGTTGGCLSEISSSLTNAAPPSTPPNAVLVAVGGLLSTLRPLLNTLGTAVVGLAKDSLGLNVNSTDVRLISLQCNGKGVQLVY